MHTVDVEKRYSKKQQTAVNNWILRDANRETEKISIKKLRTKWQINMHEDNSVKKALKNGEK